jgi:sec-independent protein translocase protein TatB
MFDVGASELLLTVIVAIVVIGPKDLPRALRMAGRWIGKMRRISGHFRSGIEEMIRQAELEDMEKKWREQNEAIMAQTAAEPAAGAPEALPSPYTTPSPYEQVHEAGAEPMADPMAPELPLGDPHGPVKP